MEVKAAPLVSVAMCTYNGELYIKEQIHSILTQDYPKIELVIVDDCSSDETIEVIESYQKEFSNITLIRNDRNKGVNISFDIAIRSCKGLLIAIADQDDIWEPTKLTRMANSIGNNLLIYHNSEFIDEAGRFIGKSNQSYHNFVKGKSTIELLYNNCIPGHAILLHRELLAILPPTPNFMYYDWWLAYTCACTGRLDYIHDTLVRHRKHSLSFTKNDKINSKSLRISNLKSFYEHPISPDGTKKLITKKLIHNLLEGYEITFAEKFSFFLLKVMTKNFRQLFFIRKRSLYSKIKFIISECSSTKKDIQ
ncbi:MAG: glycosyltransferase [Pedobacter sp.]|nr:MAG: glycosyltransferase [Pedobacter sp.]